MPVAVRIVSPGDVETILELYQPLHRIWARTIHADLAIVVESHEGEPRVDVRVGHRDIQTVTLGDWLPVGQGSPAQRIYPDLQTRGSDCIHVDDVLEIFDIRHDEVLLMRSGSLQR